MEIEKEREGRERKRDWGKREKDRLGREVEVTKGEI